MAESDSANLASLCFYHIAALGFTDETVTLYSEIESIYWFYRKSAQAATLILEWSNPSDDDRKSFDFIWTSNCGSKATFIVLDAAIKLIKRYPKRSEYLKLFGKFSTGPHDSFLLHKNGKALSSELNLDIFHK